MTDEQERQAITAAMARLFAGTPQRSSGNLDILTLAAEAGLKRNKLTHKHTDLRDLFYAEKARRDTVPERETTLRDEITALKQKNTELRDERDNYRTASEVLTPARTCRRGNPVGSPRTDQPSTLAASAGSRPDQPMVPPLRVVSKCPLPAKLVRAGGRDQGDHFD